jgi:hypothetical protein
MSKRKRPHKTKTNRISEHFSKRDFSCHCGVCNESIRISLGLVGGLELLRNLSKNRVNVKKGYMCQEEAGKYGQLKRNYHSLGLAAEVTVDNVSPYDVFLLAESVPEFRAIGLDIVNDCVYVDTRKSDERLLWVVEDSGRTELDEDNRKRYFES